MLSWEAKGDMDALTDKSDGSTFAKTGTLYGTDLVLNDPFLPLVAFAVVVASLLLVKAVK